MPTINATLAFLAACTLKALVLLALAFAAAPLLRSRSAALRHAVWASVLAAILALPLLSALAPRITVALPTPPVSTESRPAMTGQATAPRLDVDRRTVVHPTTSTARPAESKDHAPSRPLPWREALLAVWMTGGAVALGRLVVHLIRLKRVAARAVAVTDERWLRLMDEVRLAAGVRRRVRLVRGGVGVPVTWGTLRPVVMLPDGCGAWTAERRRAVLAHELAHVRRLDALTLWTARLATAAYWFVPPAWAAARRMLDESERACDDAVLRLGTLPSAYAHHLLEIAGARAPGRGRPPRSPWPARAWSAGWSPSLTPRSPGPAPGGRHGWARWRRRWPSRCPWPG